MSRTVGLSILLLVSACTTPNLNSMADLSHLDGFEGGDGAIHGDGDVQVGDGGADLAIPPGDLAHGAVSVGMSSVTVDRANGVVANGTDYATITVQLSDAAGNPIWGETVSLLVTGDGNTVTPTSGGTDTAGVFTATLASTHVETKTVTAQVGSTTLSQMPTVDFSPSNADKLVFLVQPVDTLANMAIQPSVQVQILDVNGNPVDSATNSVTMEIDTNPGSSTLGGSLSVQAINGVATFTDLTLNKKGDGYTLKATSGVLQFAVSDAFSIQGVAEFADMTISVSPKTVVANSLATTTITVTVYDSSFSPVPDQPVNVWSSGDDNTFSSTLDNTDVNGVVTFTLASGTPELKFVTAEAASIYLTTPVTFTPVGNPACAHGSAISNFGTLTAPMGANSIATGFLDASGSLDLVVASGSSSKASVFLGNGDGSFHSAVSYTVGSAPVAIAVGDFDGDGFGDVVTANSSANNVSVLLNTGVGTGVLGTAVNYAVGLNPQALLVAELDGVNGPDIVTVNHGANTISVLLNNGDGTFATQVPYATDGGPSAITSGDENGDGSIDLLIANNGGNTVSVYTNDGSGIFTLSHSPIVTSAPSSVTTGDFNGDGKLDFVTGNTNTELGFFANDSGSFATQSSSTTGAAVKQVATGDADRDGKLDLFATLASSNSLWVFPGVGDGTFATARSYPIGATPDSLVVDDFDGDGLQDAACTDGNTTVTVMRNTGCNP